MRKKLFLYVITALCLFVSASPWEGAAVTAPEGELPANGRYIATNSFPRNTVVDILNIETNKSTRVIVAGNIDSPGLLAIISREAAGLIGMRPGSVSRIRMTQPSDPVAYARFAEGLSSGISDYDSGNVITEDSYDKGFVNPASPSAAAVPDAGYSAYVLEPEWNGTASGSRNASDIELPVYPSRDKIIDMPSPSYFNEPEKTAKAGKEEAKAAETVPQKTTNFFPEDDYYEDDYYDEVAEYFPEDEYYDDDFIEEPDEIAEAGDIFEKKDNYSKPPEEIVEYNIVPTDNRPPTGIYGIDPAFIIPGITGAKKPETPNNPVVVNEPGLSVPRINELARGSYYVQLASYDTVESVEKDIKRIDQHYKPIVYKESGKYRVLLGPLNQGESAAVLARFKSIGYKDAFVKVAR